MIYTAFNNDVYNQIPYNSINILDVGCGNGAMGEALKKYNSNRNVTGLTFSADEAKLATEQLDTVIIGDLNGELPDFTQLFDCIIFSHVL